MERRAAAARSKCSGGLLSPPADDGIWRMARLSREFCDSVQKQKLRETPIFRRCASNRIPPFRLPKQSMPLRDIRIGSDAEKGSGQSKQRDLERPTANEIYEQVARNGRRELRRPARALAVSGLVGGLTMGLTGLSVSVIRAQL